MTTFEVKLIREGRSLYTFEVPANTCRGLMKVPDAEAMRKHLPRSYHRAIERGSWWMDKRDPAVPLRLDLRTADGQSMGSLFAQAL